MEGPLQARREEREMDTNLLFGYVLLGLGVVAMAAGIAISLVETMRPTVSTQSLIGDAGNLLEAIAKVLTALGTLKGGTQLFVLGLIAFLVGTYLVAAQPL
jgi:hypothetical protein